MGDLFLGAPRCQSLSGNLACDTCGISEKNMGNEHNDTEAVAYVKSLKDSVKRRFASNYLEWILGGKTGPSPSRGPLSPALAKAVCINLDALS